MKPKIVQQWKDGTYAWVTVSFESGGDGNVEYNGRTPLLNSGGKPKTIEALLKEATADAVNKRQANRAAVFGRVR